MNSRIAKGKETRRRRSGMRCRTVELKLDRSHLSKPTKAKIERLFLEAKWFINYCLDLDDINDADTTAKSVPVKLKDGSFEDRMFEMLPGAVKQGIKSSIFTSFKSLSTKKKKGYKIGAVKFKSRVDSISFPQIQWKGEPNKIQIPGFGRKRFRVHGMHQIPEDAEIACTKLVRRDRDYFMMVTIYTEWKERKPLPCESIGIDAGCDRQLTLSDGTTIKYGVQPSKRQKRLGMKTARNKYRPRSKKRDQDDIKLRAEYRKLTNKRKDIKNKVVSAIVSNFDHVCVQDDYIKGWTKQHGKKISVTGIGGMIVDLKRRSRTPIVVSRWFPSTQLCPQCGTKRKLSRGERVYNCLSCGFTADRDWKSAVCIELEGMKSVGKIPVDRRSTAGESLPSAFHHALRSIPGVDVGKVSSLNQVSLRVEEIPHAR